MRNLIIAAASLAAMTGAANAGNVLYDFEDQSAGAVITTQYAPLLTVSANSNGSYDQAMIFDTDNYTGGDSDLDAPFNTSTPGGLDGYEPGKVLIISEDGDANDPDDEARGGSLRFNFSEVVEFLDIDIFDVDYGETVSLSLYNGASLVYSVSIPGNPYIGDGRYLSFAETFLYYEGMSLADYLGGPALITRLKVRFSASGAIDNLLINTSEIPIPGALPLLLSGLAGLGFASRNRKKKA